MDDKDAMREIWPLAEAEHIFSRTDPKGYWFVWNRPRCRDGGSKPPRGLYGVGETEADAWADAARSAHNQAYWPRKPHNAQGERRTE